MNSRPSLFIALLALVIVGGAALAWRQYAELVLLRASALNPEARADLEKRIADLENDNRELSDRLAAIRTDNDNDPLAPVPAAAANPPVSSGPARGGRDGRNNAAQTAVREMLSRPEVIAAMAAQRQSATELRYATLFKNLNLTPEQAARLTAILADRETMLGDVQSVARQQGITRRSNAEAYQKLMTDAQNEIAANIGAVIGDTGLAQLQNYEQTMPQRNFVNDLQQRLGYTSAPLASAQVEQLVQILAASQPARGRENNNGNPRGVDLGGLGNGRGVQVTPAVVQQAQAILSPPQLAALQRIQQQQQAAQQIRQLVSNTLAANRPPENRDKTNTRRDTPPVPPPAER